MNYQQSIDFIQSFPDAERGLPGVKPARNLKMPLSTMKALLQAMGNPQNATATIHITGSKGKGSTATFIASMLKHAGLQTALFTSPHIHSYLERIAFDLQPVDANVFATGIVELKPLIEEFDQNGSTISTFGILTALFFHLVGRGEIYPPIYHPPAPFCIQPIQWQIVEVGLGGKDDATNVFDQKEIVVITPISLEHTAILGSTTSAIAKNKAGIIMPGCTVILAPQADKDAVEVIRKVCAQQEAQLVEVDKYYRLLEHQLNSLNQGFKVLRRGEACEPADPNNMQRIDQSSYQIQLLGNHQITNAMTALAVIEALAKRKKITITAEAIEKGLAAAFLPGRFEVIGAGACNAPLQEYSVVLDGAHNGDSAQALAKTLQQVFPDRKVILIIGVNQDKDLESIWRALKNNVYSVIATRSSSYRSLSPKEIQKRILACDPSAKIICADNIDKAVQKAQELARGNEAIICVCGSLYLVAEAREIFL